MEEQLKEQLISFETAKLAKEKSLPQDSFYFEDYGTEVPFYGLDNELNKGDEDRFGQCKSISQSLLSKWLREKYDTDVIINTYRNQNQKYYKYFISKKSKNLIKSEEYYDTYEEAFEIGLQEALKLIK